MVSDTSVETSEPAQDRQATTSGWPSLLTWRRPRGTDHARQEEQPARKEGARGGVEGVRGTRSTEKGEGALYSPPKRMRAPIPFDVGISRSPAASLGSIGADGQYPAPAAAASSSSVTLDELDSKAEEDDNQEEEADLSAAFESLARVKDRDGSMSSMRARMVSSPPRGTTFSRHSNNVSSPSRSKAPAPSSTTTPADSWLAWGTSTIRSTLPRGMLNALQITTSIDDVEENSVYLDPEPFPSPQSPRAVSHNEKNEKWKSSSPSDQDQDRIDHCLDRILGFAGVDEESRSIVTLSMPNVPANDDISHDIILQRILLRTQPLVESPGGYTLILFASATPGLEGRKGKTIWPGWTWCWKAWRSLGRSYRKNLKKLYIVHPTRFTTTLVRLISTGSYFISPKFAKKIVQCDTLESLGRSIPLNQLDLPPEVLLWDLRVNPKQDVELPTQEGDGKVPILVQDCVEALKRPAAALRGGDSCLMDREGIFRVSPSLALLRSAKYAYNLTRRPNFARFAEMDAHLPAALLKDYLRSLSKPMFPASTYGCIETCPTTSGDKEEMLQYIRETILGLLDNEHLILLSYILQCLHDISQRSGKNRMDSSNLAIVLTPNLIRSDDAVRDVMMCKVNESQLHQSHHRQGEKEEEEAEREGARSANNSPTLTTKLSDGKSVTSLGTVIAFCIDQYYEVFDEMHLELPTISFDSMLVKPRKASIGSSASRGGGGNNSRRLYDAPRTVPMSPPPPPLTMNNNNNNNNNHHLSSFIATPSSPSQDTMRTRRSSNSIPSRKRIVSGGSIRGLTTSGGGSSSGGVTGLNPSLFFDKSFESVALVDTNASGQFDTFHSTTTQRGGSNSNSRRTSLDWAEQDVLQDDDENDDDDDNNTASAEWRDALAGSPTLAPKQQQQQRASGSSSKMDHHLVARHDRRPLSEVFEE